MIAGLTSILLPSAYRPEKLKRCLTALYTSDLRSPVEVLVGLMTDDLDSRAVCSAFKIDSISLRRREEYPGGAVAGWNSLSAAACGEWLVLYADDLMADPDWLIEAQAASQRLGKPGLVGFNDLHSDGRVYASHFLVHRTFLIEHCGGRLFPPDYRAWWCDRELSDIAMAADCYIWADRARVEHRHYDWDASLFDQTYADAKELHNADRQVYERRKAAGFPHDFEPVFA